MGLNQPLLAGDVKVSTAADNATATATLAAIGQQRHFVTGVMGYYSAAVAATKNLVIKHGTTTLLTIPWDFTNGACILPLPGVLHGEVNEAVSLELAASGTGGITGTAVLFHYTE